MMGRRCDLHRQTPVGPSELLEIDHEPGTVVIHAAGIATRVDRAGRQRNRSRGCGAPPTAPRAPTGPALVRGALSGSGEGCGAGALADPTRCGPTGILGAPAMAIRPRTPPRTHGTRPPAPPPLTRAPRLGGGRAAARPPEGAPRGPGEGQAGAGEETGRGDAARRAPGRGEVGRGGRLAPRGRRRWQRRDDGEGGAPPGPGRPAGRHAHDGRRQRPRRGERGERHRGRGDRTRRPGAAPWRSEPAELEATNVRRGGPDRTRSAVPRPKAVIDPRSGDGRRGAAWPCTQSRPPAPDHRRHRRADRRPSRAARADGLQVARFALQQEEAPVACGRACALLAGTARTRTGS